MQLNLYLFEGGIGMVNRDWLRVLPVLAGTPETSGLAVSLGELVTDDPRFELTAVEATIDAASVLQVLAAAPTAQTAS